MYAIHTNFPLLTIYLSNQRAADHPLPSCKPLSRVTCSLIRAYQCEFGLKKIRVLAIYKANSKTMHMRMLAF